jgi:hypothetical protein
VIEWQQHRLMAELAALSPERPVKVPAHAH